MVVKLSHARLPRLVLLQANYPAAIISQALHSDRAECRESLTPPSQFSDDDEEDHTLQKLARFGNKAIRLV